MNPRFDLPCITYDLCFCRGHFFTDHSIDGMTAPLAVAAMEHLISNFKNPSSKEPGFFMGSYNKERGNAPPV